MNIRDLHYFVVLSETGHFGKAAELCFVSQPALSMQIKKLEEYLGVTLLERTNKSFLLTDVGVVIAEHAKTLLQQADDIRSIAKHAQNPYFGDCRIGIFPTLAPYLLPHIFPKLTAHYPDLTIYLIEEQTDKLIDQLKNGKLHAAFLALPIPDKDLITAELFEEEFLLATPKNHRFAKQKVIKQNDLEGQALLLLDEGHCMRKDALTLCNKTLAVEAEQFRATSLETLRHMVASGVGLTLMPTLACDQNKNIAYIPFSQPTPSRHIGLVWRKTSIHHDLLKEIVSEMQLILSKSLLNLNVTRRKC